MFHFAHDYTDKHKYAATLNPIIHLGCLALINELTLSWVSYFYSTFGATGGGLETLGALKGRKKKGKENFMSYDGTPLFF